MKTLLFSSAEIAQIVKLVGIDRLMDETIDGIAHACKNFDSANYSIPVRSGFSYDDLESNGLVEWMPVIRYGDKVVVKLVAYHPRNPDQFKLPTVLSTIVTFDTKSGHALSIIDATFLTSLRTGAASAVVSSALARRDSKVLGLIGAGAQAVTQLHAISRQFDLDRVLVFDTDLEACKSFSGRIAYAGVSVPISACSMQEVLAGADIVCTSTSIAVGDGPLFESASLKPGVHINAVGSDFPGKFELPKSLLQRSIVCPDFLQQALAEGECQQLHQREIGPDLLSLLQQENEHAEWREQTTVFDSTGWALEDFVAVEVLMKLGAETRCGMPVEFESVSRDPKNPYGFFNETDMGAELQPIGRLRQV